MPRYVPIVPRVEVEEKWRDLYRQDGETAVNMVTSIAGFLLAAGAAVLIAESLGIGVAAVTLVVVVEFLLGRDKGA
ncbi:hypothetical protein NHG23_01315 [Aerococcaceae bacterium NML190073]|nr:hypothetical protein [Aerococcaceae bacterium NML190073]